MGTLQSDDAMATITINNRFRRQNNNTFLYISLPFLHDYEEKLPNFTFYGGRKLGTTKFYFSFLNLILGIQLQESSPTFYEVNGWE